ncbi:hypothetical protein GCM10009555_024840 [Acrocarpospora macrocephala]|uniref:Uncharacterized protein n=1 Tax=Acrocarpospora macrocephala TaxID=150177 RepID=A0A5M3WPC0_9ACTN|nr:hypothetical protein [Acrocarpospora macrocephala]GES10386.1 hypothetical protein Amac_039830 [Acrocarpospora macrocephala]
MSEIYEKWLREYGRVFNDPRSLRTRPCPSCGRPGLRLLFNVHRTDRSVGWAEFWCDNCRKGIFFSRVSVPDWGESVTTEEKRALSSGEAPEYETIPPTTYSD